MIICKRCGAKNADSADRCGRCGAELAPARARSAAQVGYGQHEPTHRARHERPIDEAQHHPVPDDLKGTRPTRAMPVVHVPGADEGTGNARNYSDPAGTVYKSAPIRRDPAAGIDARPETGGYNSTPIIRNNARDYAPASAEKKPADRYGEADIERDLFDMGYSRPAGGRGNVAGFVACAVVIVATLFMCWATFTTPGQKWKAVMGLNAPASAYWDAGRDSYNAQDYTAAVGYFEAALLRDPDNYEGLLNLAQALETTGDYERAKRACLRAISVRPEQLATYMRLISLMEHTDASNAEFAEIYSLAYKNTGDVTFAESAARYTPGEVRANYAGGDYSHELQLQLASDIGATIRYTLDGSTPNADANVYSEPIVLSQGVYTLRAVAMAGAMAGPELSSTYNIYLPVVEAPSFLSKPGKYQADDNGRKSILVNVPAGATVYYTTNGDAPSTRSEMYEQGISLSRGEYTIRMIAVSSGGQMSEEVSAEYRVIGELPDPFGPEDQFRSFKVGVTTLRQVNDRFDNLIDTIGNEDTFFTQVYNFGEVDFTVNDGAAIVTAVRITNSDITGVRGAKVGWSAADVIDEFRDEGYPVDGHERILYALSEYQHGWLTYSDEQTLTGIHYTYTESNNLVELNFTVSDDSVTAMEYVISVM